MEIPINSAPIIPILQHNSVQLFLKREDLIHPEISGNKFWKLFFNIENYKSKKVSNPLLITFGGAYSNHIAAAAKVGYLEKIPTLGIIRGDELEEDWKENPTLKLAAEHEMQFRFVTRESYRNKKALEEKLLQEFLDCCIIPEGGSNVLAVKGIQHMLNNETKQFDYLCAAVGTGGTLAGISKFCDNHQKPLGFSVVKDSQLEERIYNWSGIQNFELVDASFGGYGKIKDDNIRFVNDFKKSYNIQLDAIYTGKMMKQLMKMIHEDFFPKGSKILAFHTGGLQGNLGVNHHLIKKNKAIID